MDTFAFEPIRRRPSFAIRRPVPALSGETESALRATRLMGPIAAHQIPLAMQIDPFSGPSGTPVALAYAFRDST